MELVPGSIAKIQENDRCDGINGPKVCIGAGTGLGECFLICTSTNPSVRYECFPSEGGHVEYAPSNKLEEELWAHLKQEHGTRDRISGDLVLADRISVERIASGKGLADVYSFLAGKYPFFVDDKVHEQFKNAGTLQGKVVGDNAKRGNLCGTALEIFARYDCLKNAFCLWAALSVASLLSHFYLTCVGVRLIHKEHTAPRPAIVASNGFVQVVCIYPEV